VEDLLLRLGHLVVDRLHRGLIVDVVLVLVLGRIFPVLKRLSGVDDGLVGEGDRFAVRVLQLDVVDQRARIGTGHDQRDLSDHSV
jgi:hypothetical protein